ncbi:hypothetical protein DFH09DRAFT_1335755 [Mycena vulgaris]|nr:hypothetical protein DFH09DRAFT_1335755 [Mycena vulgaris]
MDDLALPRRTLRSGKEFSPFDLARGRAIAPPIHFDVGDCIRTRILEAESTGLIDEPAPIGDDPEPLESPPPWLPDAAAPTASTSTLPPPLLDPLLTPIERNKLKSKLRRAKRREEDRAMSDNPLLKGVHRKRIEQGKLSALELEIDTSELPHSRPAWMGSRAAQDEPFEFSEPAAPHDLGTGLGGVMYTQAEVDQLSGTVGFMYINWLGFITIPIIDSHRRLIALLGGTPRDVVGWQAATDGAAALLEERATRIRVGEDDMNHRRAQEPYAAVSRGASHGGGQTEPGDLQNNKTNTKVTDELLAHPHFQRLAAFANILFAMWAPLLFAFYQVQMRLLFRWKPSLRKNFVGSIFAACTFNFGPRAITLPHLDFGNLSWGWCAITALGRFDPDLGGHLILWDLRLIIRFPPGSTVLIPSALIRHSNIPIRAHEYRSSFTQYTAAGLFRWIRNGFQTDEDYQLSASPAELAARNEENEGRWEEGMKMFSVIDDL